MTNTNVRRGNKWAADICRSLVAAGFKYAEPRKAGSAHDTGDVAGVHGPSGVVCIEAKRWKAIELSKWVDQALAEAARVGPEAIGIAWAHRVGKASPDDGYVVMDGRTAMRLLREAGYQ